MNTKKNTLDYLSSVATSVVPRGATAASALSVDGDSTSRSHGTAEIHRAHDGHLSSDGRLTGDGQRAGHGYVSFAGAAVRTGLGAGQARPPGARTRIPRARVSCTVRSIA